MALFCGPPTNAAPASCGAATAQPVQSSSSVSDTVAIWLRTEPFVFSALPLAPHSKLTFGHIKKILGYLRSKSPQTFPKMNFQMWQHITVHKMAIPAELGQIYFETFLHFDSNLELSAEMAEQKPHQQGQSPLVDARRFVVFLMLQHLHKISLRSSLQGGEEWPARCRSPDVDQRQQLSNRSFDENAHQIFFLNNLEDILVALQDPTGSAQSSAGNSDLKSPRPTLSWASVRALDFVLSGSPDNFKTIMPFSQLFRNCTNGEQLQSSSVVLSENTYLLRHVESFVRSHMSPNPFGLVACSLNGKRLVWPFQGEDRDARLERGGKILTNSHTVAAASMPLAGAALAAGSTDFFRIGNKVVAILQAHRQTLARQSTTLSHSILRISRCQLASIYPIAPLRACVIDKCRSTTIVLGAIQTTLYVTGCENVTIAAACRRLVVVNCVNCTFYLLTPTSPLIIGNNEGITLAPYNVVHPLLSEQLAGVSLPAKPNKWDEFRQPSSDWSSSTSGTNNDCHLTGSGEQAQQTIRLMDPSEFCLGRIPFELEGPDGTSRLLVKLPPPYQASLDSAEDQLAKWTSHVRRILTRSEQQDELEAFTMRHFKEWLLSTGNSVQIESLTVKSSSASSAAVVSSQATGTSNATNKSTRPTSGTSTSNTPANAAGGGGGNNRDRVEVVSLE